MILAATLGGTLVGFLAGCYVTNRFAERAMARMDRGYLCLIGGLTEVMSMKR